MSKFLILGCGPSASRAIDLEGYTVVGVNDSARFHALDLHVILDKAVRFSPRRLDVIENTFSACLYTQLEEKDIRTKAARRQMITLAKKRGWINDLGYNFSHHSTFVAAQIAVELGATSLTFVGVDIVNHPNFTKRDVVESRTHLEQMCAFYIGKGIKIYDMGEKLNIFTGIPGVEKI